MTFRQGNQDQDRLRSQQQGTRWSPCRVIVPPRWRISPLRLLFYNCSLECTMAFWILKLYSLKEKWFIYISMSAKRRSNNWFKRYWPANSMEISALLREMFTPDHEVFESFNLDQWKAKDSKVIHINFLNIASNSILPVGVVRENVSRKIPLSSAGPFLAAGRVKRSRDVTIKQ